MQHNVKMWSLHVTVAAFIPYLSTFKRSIQLIVLKGLKSYKKSKLDFLDFHKKADFAFSL